MADTPLLLSLARIATAALAGALGALALRAHRHTRRRDLLALGVGASLLAAGYLAEGILVEAAGWSLADATALESVNTLVALTILVASLYVRDARIARLARAPAGGAPP